MRDDPRFFVKNDKKQMELSEKVFQHLNNAEKRMLKKFKNTDELLQEAESSFGFTSRLSNEFLRFFEYDNPIDLCKETADIIDRILTCWQKRIKKSSSSIPLVEIIKQNRLNKLEINSLMLIILSDLGMLLPHTCDTPDEIHRALLIPNSHKINVIRTLSDREKLIQNSLVLIKDEDTRLARTSLEASQHVINSVLYQEKQESELLINKEEDLETYMEKLLRAFDHKVESAEQISKRYFRRNNYVQAARNVTLLIENLNRTLKCHRDWALSKGLELCGESEPDWMIILALTALERTPIDLSEDLSTGLNLSRIASRDPESTTWGLRRLGVDAPLIKNEIIQPVSGLDQFVSTNPAALQKIEFELTDKTRQLLGIDKVNGEIKNQKTKVIKPRISLDKVSLSDSTRNAVNMALNHVNKSSKLMNEWGLAEVFHYGAGATLMFYGPPGTGKTATAEAIAHELGKTLLVADYSKIQNCFVGMTEKNIVSVFNTARKHDAVLFWDEADAMFFDRDSAAQNWEVRNVNVLLQEIENFKGVCILATNRNLSLDDALNRRITAKVEFERPDLRMRREIWEMLLPKKMPLGHDVCLEDLAKHDLSGGEIKNVILNAARMALEITDVKCVSAEHFNKAIEMELNSTQKSKTTIGFAA